MLYVPVLVSADKRGVHDVMLPGISDRTWRGVSLAELLDDVALDLMERLPKAAPAEVAKYRLCPDLELRRVKTSVRVGGSDRNPVFWEGRLTVVVTQWPKERFKVCWVPRLGTALRFAVSRTAHLGAALARVLAAEIKAGRLNDLRLEREASRGYEYLEVLEVDADLPTVLPSRPPKRKKKKGKKARGVKAKAAKKKAEPRKRRLVPPVTLRQVGTDLTHRAIDGRLGAAFGRDTLVEQLLKQLTRPGAAILLVGPSGVGKTAIVHEIVRRLAALGKPLHERTDVWAVDGNRIIAGMSVVGAWEQRTKDMVHELEARDDILYVDDLPGLVYTGRSRSSDTNVAEYLAPHLARGDLRIIGECTAERLAAVREEAPGFFSRFQVIHVPELSERETLMVLVDTLRAVEAREPVVIEPEVLEGVLGLTRRFQRREAHPGKAIALLTQLVTDYGQVKTDDRGRRVIGRDQLVDYFARRTGLPRFVLWEQQSREHAEVLAHFERRIIGQPAAARTAADLVCVLQQGLDDPDRPLGTLLFVGPTGVGKTETAKALAAYLFGTADRLIRFDMSEFRDPLSTARLFGDRFQPEGELTRRVAQQPFSVVLFDEIEKAHPQVFDAFLQVFGEGRLTNAAGRTTDFCSTILVMTSNLGVADAEKGLGFATGDQTTRDAHFIKAAEGFFRPEFFNRIDRVVPFRNLQRDDLGPLVQRTLEGILGRRGLRRSGVLVDVAPELVELLVDQGFDPKFGARSLRRALEQRLTVPLAAQLIGQPVDRTTLVGLDRFGADIGVTVWALEDQPAAVSPLPELADWAALLARVERLRVAREGLLAGALEARFEAERSALIAGANARTLDDAGWARLAALNGVFEPGAGLPELDALLDQIQTRWLDRYDYVEDVELVGPSYRDLRRWDVNPSPKPVGTLRPVERAVARLNGRVVTDVERATALLASLAARIDALQHPTAERLVQILPATPDRHSRRWAKQVAVGWLEGASRRAQARLYLRTEAGWTPSRPALLRDEAVDHFALHVTGAMLDRLVDPELGFHLWVDHVGADLVCSLARVQALPGHGDPVARLTAADAAFEAWRAARLRGEDAPSPRPALPIARRYEGDARPGQLVAAADARALRAFWAQQGQGGGA